MEILFKLNKLNQQRQHEKAVWVYPIMLAMYATALRNQGNKVIWDSIDNGSFDRVITSESQIDIPFLQLPHADRILTDVFNSKWQNNGNFKYRPGTYIQSASHCTWGRCTFCVERGKTNEIREVEDVIGEIRECKELGAAEIFDDSASFPTGDWLYEFCRQLGKLSNGRGEKIVFSCNSRISRLVDYNLLKRSGFRMLLFGIESANQETLDKIQKGVHVEDIIPTIKSAAEAGLDCHISCMFGFPWETDIEAQNTLRLVHYLLRKGYAKTAQASFYCPKEGKGNETQRKYVNRIYSVAKFPSFWINKIRDIKSVEDLKYFWRSIKEGVKCLRKSV